MARPQDDRTLPSRPARREPGWLPEWLVAVSIGILLPLLVAGALVLRMRGW